MIRKFSTACIGALLLATFAAGPAGASSSVNPVTGTITCDMAGQVVMNKPLPNSNSADGALRNIHFKLTAKMANCGAGSTGGKMPITSGALTISGILEIGSSCADISDGSAPDISFDPNKFDAKWTGTADNGKHPTVAHSKTNDTEIGDVIFGGWEYVSGPFRDNDAFAGESATLDLLISNPADVFKCETGKTNADGSPSTLGLVTFGAGSTISVGP